MKFEDVQDSRVKNSISLFEFIAKVHPFAYFTRQAIKIGLTTKDEMLKEAFELKLESSLKENPRVIDQVRDVQLQIRVEQAELEDSWFWLNR
ncbi:hypothetical protein LHA31_05095 [Carnobacterium viridans]|uniref:Uncharacterized protein n=1 Tax=Carnobacterium viridans TaxID=174587 RepID=A0A1H1AQI8_9LACT|nr:hypothetical protein [Carnobacterium viridans]UDE96096.1 hypothetical protein LHA31_05095 [Carnobacterium viridans]SDQ41929.1 hypothetical protein SAMN04487752_2211 [Carnobacterium viridans]